MKRAPITGALLSPQDPSPLVRILLAQVIGEAGERARMA
jgi:hypothetical protein